MNTQKIAELFKEHMDQYNSFDHIEKGYVIDGNEAGKYVFLLFTTNSPTDDLGFVEQREEMMDTIDDMPEVEDIILYGDKAQLERVANEMDAYEIEY